MPFLEIDRKPSRSWANSNRWQNGNTSVRQRLLTSIWDLAKRRKLWIGWKNLIRIRRARVGIYRLIRFTTACATSRVSSRSSKRFLARANEDRQLLRRTEAAQRHSPVAILSCAWQAGLNLFTLEALANVEPGWDEISELASVLE